MIAPKITSRKCNKNSLECCAGTYQSSKKKNTLCIGRSHSLSFVSSCYFISLDTCFGTDYELGAGIV